jgi:superfamily II DNA or RNA helicase
MAEILSLRGYQREAIDAVQDAHADGMGYPAVVLPTGAGKTVCFAHLAAEHLGAGNTRNLILVHRDELADQAMDKVRRVAPGLSVGKVKAQDDEVSADVVVASVQTVSRRARLERLTGSQSNRPFGLITTDECHHSVAASYRKVYDAMPEALRVGFTATLARGDGVGLGSVIDDVVYRKSWLWMIKNEYLVDIRAREVTAESLDLGSVRRSGGDYAAGSLGSAMVDTGTGAVIARAYLEHAHDRPGVVFTPTVAAAHDVAGSLLTVGITAAVVDQSTSRADRLMIYEASRRGNVQVIVNCNVLTEGADFPWLSCVVPRITWSAPLFQQMTGRVMRLYPGKADALLLSVGGVGGRLRTLVDLAPGEVQQVMAGESVTEAADREEARGDERTSGATQAFRLRHREADLFAGSRARWLRTHGGVYFVPVADGEVFLWPQPDGRWQVRHSPRNTTRLKIRWPVLHRDLDLSMAMAWGESEADDRDTGTSSVARRNAPWRRGKDPVSADQLAACRRWSIDVPAGTTKAQAGDLLSVHHASIKFDHFLPRTKEYT